MVTIQELESQRAEQEKVLQEPLPPRRFGAGVDVRRQQQELILRQSVARENIAIINRNREILDAQQSQSQEVQRQLERGRRGRPASFGIARKNPEAYAAYQKGKAERQQNVQIELNQIQRQELTKQGLKPIESKGQVVGFEDTVRGQSFSTSNIPVSAQARLRSAGIKVTETKPIEGATQEELIKQQSIRRDLTSSDQVAEEETEKKGLYTKVNDFLKSKVTEPIALKLTSVGITGQALEKSARQTDLSTKGIIGRNKITNIGATPLGIFTTQKIRAVGRSIRQSPLDWTIIGGISAISGGIGGVVARSGPIVKTSFSLVSKGTTALFVGATGYQVYKAPTFAEKTDILAVAGAQTGFAVGISKSFNYFTKPITLKRDPLKPLVTSETKILNIRKGGKGIDIAAFEVTATQPARFAYVAPRYAEIGRKIAGIASKRPVKELSFSELELIQPRGQKVLIQQASTSKVTTEPFVSKDGRIFRPLRESNTVGIFTQAKTATRNQPLRLGRIYGSLQGSPDLLKNVKPRTLGQVESTALKALQKEFRFPDDTTFVGGAVETKNIGKLSRRSLMLTNKQFDILNNIKTQSNVFRFARRGRSTSRSTLASAQRSENLITYDREFGLIESEILKSKVAFVDTTFPRLKAPSTKAVRFLEDRTIRNEINLESQGGDISENIIKSTSSTGLKRAQRQVQSQSLDVFKASAGQRAVQSLSKVTIPVAPRAGTIGKTALTGAFASALLPKVSTAQTQATSQVQNQQPAIRTVAREFATVTQAQVPRSVAREVTREVSREIAREVTREITRQQTRQQSRQILRIIPRQVTRQRIRFAIKSLPRKSSTKGRLKLPSFGLGKGSFGGELTKGFQTFVRTKGKDVLLPGLFSKGEALQRGKGFVLGGLSAQFRIKETKRSVRASSSRTPDLGLFREFRIKGRQRIATPLSFIQRTRQEGGARGGRLASVFEVRAIQAARRAKGQSIKGAVNLVI